jgi:hypothetical protein
MEDHGIVIWPYKPIKFKGKMLGELPSSFVKWVAENCREKFLCESADKEWQHREKYNCHFEDDPE